MSSSIVPAKRSFSEIDDAPASLSLHPAHPLAVLEHLVEKVLPGKCASERAKTFYQKQLDDPKGTINECKTLLADWVTEYWGKGQLKSVDHLNVMYQTEFPQSGVIYTIILIINGEPWFYVGQAINGRYRIISCHEKVSYRNRNPSFLYFLWSRAESVHFVLPVSNSRLVSGPIFNILEQWCALIFSALQPSEMRNNMSLPALKTIPDKDIKHGVNVREPLGQGLGFQDFSRASLSFVHSNEPLKKQYHADKLQLLRQAVPRKKTLLDGDIYPGSFWPLNRAGWIDYEFVIYHVRFLVGTADINRLERESIKIHCDLLPEGQVHPNSISRFLPGPTRYMDPARRLGIKISGIRVADQQENFLWVERRGDPDRWLPKLNRLVDWLESLDPEELRPRRPYGPDNMDLPPDFYTRHPLDSGDAWNQLVDFETFTATTLRGIS